MKINLNKSKLKRKYRARKKSIAELGATANKNIDRHIFRRWTNLQNAKRFIAGWLTLLVLLITGVALQTSALGKHYLEPSPVGGGVITEGIKGAFSNGNPLYAASVVDSSVAKLVFSSLMTYDNNGKLAGDLAESWDMSTNGQVFTVKIKPNTYWHDGKKLTSKDVVYTYKTIQNPDSKSPLSSGWKGIKIEAVNEKTVKFTLPSPYAPFLNLLTNGIVPEHILGQKSVESLRGDQFNTQTLIGSGPFEFKRVVGKSAQAGQEIILSANEEYHDGAPQLEGFSFKTYEDSNKLAKDLKAKKVTTASGLSYKDQELPTEYSYPFVQNSATMLFIKTTSPNVADVKVRQALIKGTVTKNLSAKNGFETVSVKAPLLSSQAGYNKDIEQFVYAKPEAEKLLDEAGWVKTPNAKYRQKDGKELSLKLVSENNEIYPQIATELQKQWADIGVKLDVSFVTPEQITQTYIPNHEYDIFLYGVNIGPDPDVYAYWHSSQAAEGSPRLNLSEYKSPTSDLALESARSRANTELRVAKYKPFLTSFKNDVPAIGLYQPRYLYLASQPIYGIDNSRHISSPEERFNNVNNWKIHTARMQKD